MPREAVRGTALQFVVLIGVVSLFADMTYEGARGVTGPFMAVLGASATVVGVVAGLGELIGYLLRLLSGYLGDRTQRYWPITLWGYAVNMLAVPLLALAWRWEAAAVLIIAERLGKGIRTPPRDVLLSHAAARLGQGRAFGLHEALDQIGAVAGPLMVAGVLYMRGGYQLAFAMLLAPALLALAFLVGARILYPEPRQFEAASTPSPQRGFPRQFWIYLASVALLAAGYADFPLIAFHLKKASVVSDAWIPVFYGFAMAVDAVAALILGRLFDTLGLRILLLVPLVSCPFAPLVFSESPTLALLGTAFWGAGMGAQESIVRAAIAAMIPADRRGTAYGVFNAGYGIAWFAGSAAMGMLYDVSITYLVAFSVLAQLLAVPILYAMVRDERARKVRPRKRPIGSRRRG